jgi:hypothetical protein
LSIYFSIAETNRAVSWFWHYIGIVRILFLNPIFGRLIEQLTSKYYRLMVIVLCFAGSLSILLTRFAFEFAGRGF